MDSKYFELKASNDREKTNLEIALNNLPNETLFGNLDKKTLEAWMRGRYTTVVAPKSRGVILSIATPTEAFINLRPGNESTTTFTYENFTYIIHHSPVSS
jgi:hypothetical protein